MSDVERLNVIDKVLALPDKNSQPHEYEYSLAFYAAIDYAGMIKREGGAA